MHCSGRAGCCLFGARIALHGGGVGRLLVLRRMLAVAWCAGLVFLSLCCMLCLRCYLPHRLHRCNKQSPTLHSATVPGSDPQPSHGPAASMAPMRTVPAFRLYAHEPCVSEEGEGQPCQRSGRLYGYKRTSQCMRVVSALQPVDGGGR